jgi:hypothetical protein
MRALWLAAGLFALTAAVRAAGSPDPAPFDAVLAERARGGGFDYRGVDGQDRKRLAAYLSNLGDADPKGMADGEKKAFFINAYNAMAIAIVLERYPVKSIRDVDGAFDGIRKRIGGEMLTLDDIENRLRAMKDARIHFAIVCASKSCPPLAARAYAAAGLDAALDTQARAFVNDPSKNRLDRFADRVALSKIFDWNRKEFERDGGSLFRYVAQFVSGSATSRWLTARLRPPEFLEYDWALNQP